MKIKSHSTLILIFIITVSNINNTWNVMFSNSIKNENLNSVKNEKFQLSVNLKNQLKSQTKLSLANSFSNLINFNYNEKLGGFPPVVLTNEYPEKKSSHYNGWGKLMILDKNNNPKKYIKEFCKNKYDTQHNNKFFFSLNDNFLTAYYTEKNPLNKNYATIYIHDLYPINLSSPVITGGVEDLGNFKEGFCTQLNGRKIELNQNFQWVICSETYNEKSQFINYISKLKLKDQGLHKIKKNLFENNLKLKINDSLNSKKINNSLYNIKPGKNKGELKDLTPKSRWITLKDWGDCTLACGGGFKYKHRYCYMPEGAQPCIGEAILKKSCNEKPCNEINIPELNKEQKGVETQIMPTLVKMRCQIKEEDMNIIRSDLSDKQYKNLVKLPSRVIINNNSISIYQSDTPDSLFRSYNLKDLQIIKPYSKEPNTCIEVGIRKETTVLCSIQEIPQNKSKDFIEKWIDQLKDFKNNCNPSTKNHKKISEDYYKNPEVLAFINQLQEKKLMENLNKFNTNRNIEKSKKSTNDFHKQLKIAQILAWKALDKELKYEERLEKEELLREQKEKEKVKLELLTEQKKRDNICKAINFGKKNDAVDIKKKFEYNKQIEQIKKDIQAKIVMNRKKFNEKIHNLKKAHERKIMKTKSQITEIRKTVTTNIIRADKKGDLKKCKSKTTTEYRTNYCNDNFIDDIYYNLECKKEKEFCAVCCENEFGELHQQEREKCLIKCENFK